MDSVDGVAAQGPSSAGASSSSSSSLASGSTAGGGAGEQLPSFLDDVETGKKRPRLHLPSPPEWMRNRKQLSDAFYKCGEKKVYFIFAFVGEMGVEDGYEQRELQVQAFLGREVAEAEIRRIDSLSDQTISFYKALVGNPRLLRHILVARQQVSDVIARAEGAILRKWDPDTGEVSNVVLIQRFQRIEGTNDSWLQWIQVLVGGHFSCLDDFILTTMVNNILAGHPTYQKTARITQGLDLVGIFGVVNSDNGAARPLNQEIGKFLHDNRGEGFVYRSVAVRPENLEALLETASELSKSCFLPNGEVWLETVQFSFRENEGKVYFAFAASSTGQARNENCRLK